MDYKSDIQAMVKLLGADGAIAGFRNSKRLTLNEIKKIADGLGIDYKSKIKRNDLIDLLILQFSRKIDKSIEEMTQMSSADLCEYLHNTNCSKEELMFFLDENDIPYKKSESRVVIIQHVADQISKIGVYKRIAKQD